MHDIIDLPRTPSMARFVKLYSLLYGINLPNSVQDLAKQDCLDTELASMPYTVTTVSKSALQYLTDNGGSGLFLVSRASPGFALVLNYMSMKKPERTIIFAHHTEHKDWYNLITTTFPDKRVEAVTRNSKKSLDPEKLDVVILEEKAFTRFVTDFSPDYTIVSGMTSMPDHVLGTTGADSTSIGCELNPMTILLYVSPAKLKSNSIDKEVSMDWLQHYDTIGLAEKLLLANTRLAKLLKSSVNWRMRISNRNLAEGYYSDWLKLINIYPDLLFEPEYSERILRWSTLIDDKKYGNLTEKQIESHRAGKRSGSETERNEYKQIKAIESFEKFVGPLYDTLYNWAIKGKLPENVTVTELIENYENLSRGNFLEDKVHLLIPYLISSRERSLVVANSRYIGKAVEHRMNCSRLSGSVNWEDKFVEKVIDNWRNGNHNGSRNASNALVINYAWAKEYDLLKDAQKCFILEYPNEFKHFQDMLKTTDDTRLPVIFTRLKHTWEDSLVSILFDNITNHN